MKFSFLFIFTLIRCTSVAQIQEFDLVENVYRQWHAFSFNQNNNCDHFLFKDSIDIDIIVRAKNMFIRRKAFHSVRYAGQKQANDSILFDSSEIRYILNELTSLNNNKWPGNLFKNSKKLLPYQVDSMYLSMRSWNVDPNIKLCYNVYTFSRPIFLRNNTLCLFYTEERSFVAREGEFWIYKLKRKEWKKYDVIYLLKK